MWYVEDPFVHQTATENEQLRFPIKARISSVKVKILLMYSLLYIFNREKHLCPDNERILLHSKTGKGNCKDMSMVQRLVSASEDERLQKVLKRICRNYYRYSCMHLKLTVGRKREPVPLNTKTIREMRNL